MSSIRLFVLGALAQQGAMHGYELRKLAEEMHLQNWTDVGIGGLYGTLTRLADEQLILEVRQEKEGARPERRVFEITDAGIQSLVDLREQTLRTYRLTSDPVDIAYAWPHDDSGINLAAAIAERREGVEQELAIREQRLVEKHDALTARELVVMRHGIYRLRAELDWLDDVRRTALEG